MSLPDNASTAYRAGYKAAKDKLAKRKGNTPLVPSRADRNRWAADWTEYIAGWKQALLEDRERAIRWETQ